MKQLSWFLIAVVTVVGGLTVVNHKYTPQPIPQTQPWVQPPPIQQIPPPPQPRLANISVRMPSHLSYNNLVAQLDKWNQEAPDLTERGSYGQSTRKQLLQYIRVTNVLKKEPKKVVLITACIHGNEPLACGNVMALIGAMLSDYGKKQEVTDLIDTRDIYFIPVVSPDSYPNARHVDGVDPNRNFPGPKDPNRVSVPPVKALQDFVVKIKPNGVISGHTWGQVMLIPWGDDMTPCPDNDQYRNIIGQMAKLAGYRMMRACDMYKVGGGLNNPPPKALMIPIYGSEVDWYYRQGAMAIVVEMGTHQRIPSITDIQTEHQMTYKAFLYFIKEAPEVKLKINQ